MSKLNRTAATVGAFAVLLTVGGIVMPAPAHAETYEQCAARKQAEHPTTPLTASDIKVCEWARFADEMERRKAREAATATPTSTPTYTPPSRWDKAMTKLGNFLKFALIVGGILVVLGLVMAAVSSADDKKQQARKQREDARIGRGRKIATDWHADRVAEARAAMPTPDPAVYDPHGLGLAAPQVDDPVVPRPPMETADLLRYAEFSAVVPWVEGTAFAAVVNRDGTSRLAAAWREAVAAAELGDFDDEGNLVPYGTFVGIEVPLDGSGDVRIKLRPRDIHVTERDLNKVHEYLAKAAKVQTVFAFERQPSSGEYWALMSMRKPATNAASKAQAKTEQQPEQPRVDPRWS